jgi:hypothetical protein
MIVGPGPSAFGGATVDSPRFSRSISTISPGSLSSAYRAMKTFGEAGEAAAGIASMPPPAALGAPAGEGVVQSGQGVPGALAAYDEVIDKA